MSDDNATTMAQAMEYLYLREEELAAEMEIARGRFRSLQDRLSEVRHAIGLMKHTRVAKRRKGAANGPAASIDEVQGILAEPAP